MIQPKEMDRYEKRARQLVAGMNAQIKEGTLIPGTKEYSDREWMIRAFFKASKTYKPS